MSEENTQVEDGKYFRTGIAIKKSRKPIYDERMAALGMKTAGDLISFFILADGIVETLKPLMDEYVRKKREAEKGETPKQLLLKKMRGMSPEQIDDLFALANKVS